MYSKDEKRLEWMSEKFGIPIIELEIIVGIQPRANTDAIETAWLELHKTDRGSDQQAAALDKLCNVYAETYDPKKPSNNIIYFDGIKTLPMKELDNHILAIIEEIDGMDINEVWLKYGNKKIPKTCTSQMHLCKSNILINFALIVSAGSPAQQAALKAIYKLDSIG